jgi:hypothetical protein
MTKRLSQSEFISFVSSLIKKTKRHRLYRSFSNKGLLLLLLLAVELSVTNWYHEKNVASEHKRTNGRQDREPIQFYFLNVKCCDRKT